MTKWGSRSRDSRSRGSRSRDSRRGAHRRLSRLRRRESQPSDLRSLAARVVSERDSQDVLLVEQPFNGWPLGEVPRSTLTDVDLAYDRARAAQEIWKDSTFAARRRILLHFHDLLLDRSDELLDLIQLETGKARRHAMEEVLDVATVARYYANTARHHLRTQRRRGASPF